VSERPEPGRDPAGAPPGERDEVSAGSAIGREAEPERPAGSAIGREAEPERPAGSVPERASLSGGLPADQPDEGWQDWPGGHREGGPADDDLQRRKG